MRKKGVLIMTYARKITKEETTCPDCGDGMIQCPDDLEWYCISSACTKITEMQYYYEAICWSCGADIDSRIHRRSETRGMGYHCGLCGKDLTEWKRMILKKYDVPAGV